MVKTAAETLLRQWVMLRRIPRFPRTISTRALTEALRDEGYSVGLRTVQRDLLKLSAAFGFSYQESDRGWYWPPHALGIEIPTMEASTALALHLMHGQLEWLLPRETLALLGPYFERADAVLASERGRRLARWPARVRVIHRGPGLLPVSVPEEVQQAVYRGLLEKRQVEIHYRAREAPEHVPCTLNPLALVLREGVIYVVGTLWNYTDVRHFALHRICEAHRLDRPCRRPKGFDLDAYLGAQQEFSYPTGAGPIGLKVRFEAGAAWHLRERPLAPDQQITEASDGWVLVEATVLDTAELRWWLLGFGDGVEVLAPEGLRQDFRAMARRMAGYYGAGPDAREDLSDST